MARTFMVTKTEHPAQIEVDGVFTPLPSIWTVTVTDGARQHELRFDHDPTDDEVLAELPEDGRYLQPTNQAERLDTVVALCARYVPVRQVTDLPNFTTLFTAQEQQRLITARDALVAQIKAYV